MCIIGTVLEGLQILQVKGWLGLRVRGNSLAVIGYRFLLEEDLFLGAALAFLAAFIPAAV